MRSNTPASNIKSPTTSAAIEKFMQQQNDLDLLRFITCGSVDDGKSTLIGCLLYEAKCIFDDQVASLKQESITYGTQGDDDPLLTAAICARSCSCSSFSWCIAAASAMSSSSSSSSPVSLSGPSCERGRISCSAPPSPMRSSPASCSFSSCCIRKEDDEEIGTFVDLMCT